MLFLELICIQFALQLSFSQPLSITRLTSSHSTGLCELRPPEIEDDQKIVGLFNLGNLKSNYHMTLFFCITKTNLYKFDPLKPHFYIVKLGFIGVYIIFLISAQKRRLWVLVKTAPRRDGSNEYPQSTF